MALADLKKNATSANVAFIESAVSLEDFIEDATRYAQGEQLLVSAHTPTRLTLVNNEYLAIKQYSGAKNATFSLNEKVILQLAELAKHDHIAKSKLIRNLVEREYFMQTGGKT